LPALLFWLFVLFSVLFRTYPVPPVTAKPENVEWGRWLRNEENRALLREENMALFVGTWSIASPHYKEDRWEKTRLSIRPDGTFILTDPPERLDDLEGFRGTLEGEWSIDVFHSWNLPHPLAIHYTTGKDAPSLHSMVLRTTHRDSTDKKHLRLFFFPVLDPDYPDHRRPAWERIADE